MFGSTGSFFASFWPTEGAWALNPPFIAEIAVKATHRLVGLLDASEAAGTALCFAVVVPITLADHAERVVPGIRRYRGAEGAEGAVEGGTDGGGGGGDGEGQRGGRVTRITLSVGDHSYARGDQHQESRGGHALQEARVDTAISLYMSSEAVARFPEGLTDDIITDLRASFRDAGGGGKAS
jgi:hypothetical protein